MHPIRRTGTLSTSYTTLESRDKHGIYKYFVLPFKTKQVACKLPETARTRLFIGMYHDARNGLEKLLSLTVSLQSTTIIG